MLLSESIERRFSLPILFSDPSEWCLWSFILLFNLDLSKTDLRGDISAGVEKSENQKGKILLVTLTRFKRRASSLRLLFHRSKKLSDSWVHFKPMKNSRFLQSLRNRFGMNKLRYLRPNKAIGFDATTEGSSRCHDSRF